MISYRKLKNKLQNIEILINKGKTKEAKELYFLFEEEFKKWLKEAVLLIENCFKNESIINKNLSDLIQQIWFDPENIFFDKIVIKYIQEKEVKIEYEAKISRLLKILNLRRIKFWREVEKLFDDIIDVLDFFTDKKFRLESGNKYLNKIKKRLRNLENQ